ncbi:MAG: type IV pilus twitching motility protein PilT [Planctomycetes bacterium]|nr:type IV pilus twitching motility protein PilT [Planctomycetota bacterium]
MHDILALMDACHERGASDLHLSEGRAPVLRINGHLVEIEGQARLTGEDLERMVHEITPERNRRELEEVGSSDFGIAHRDMCRFRVSVFTQRGTRASVMRRIPDRMLSFEQIGLPAAVRDLLTMHRGLVLVTGPTGSGKTTTLATMLDWINRNRDVHIITIEDPIEFVHAHKKSQVTQREVGTDVASFGEAMRRALRQDPDVILLGEMRDLETTSAAITAAETGHLVFGTLHTTGAARTVDRIIDQYPTEQQEQIRAQLAVALVAVISQILVPNVDESGRVAAFEVMICNAAIENHIRKTETFKIPSVIQTSRRQGMMLLDDSLLELYRAGRIAREAALERAFDAKALEQKMGGGA